MGELDIKDLSGDLAEDLDRVLSTYQWVTVGQILETYGIQLPGSYVVELIRTKTSFFYQLLKIPVINILNGIIIEQIITYQIFVQKLFVEYFVSGSADVEESMGADTRKHLEEARNRVLQLGKLVETQGLEREKFIIESQRKLSAWVKNFSALGVKFCKDLQVEITAISHEKATVSLNSFYHLFIDADGFVIQDAARIRFWQEIKVNVTSDLENVLSSNTDKVKEIEVDFTLILDSYYKMAIEARDKLNELRKDFYLAIATVQNLLNQLPGFQFDEAEDAKNRSQLMFDAKIGDDDSLS